MDWFARIHATRHHVFPCHEDTTFATFPNDRGQFRKFLIVRPTGLCTSAVFLFVSFKKASHYPIITYPKRKEGFRQERRCSTGDNFAIGSLSIVERERRPCQVNHLHYCTSKSHAMALPQATMALSWTTTVLPRRLMAMSSWPISKPWVMVHHECACNSRGSAIAARHGYTACESYANTIASFSQYTLAAT